MTIAWGDVQTKGYVVVPSFLSEPEIEILTAAFAKIVDSERLNPNFNTRYAPREARAPFVHKVVRAAKRASRPELPMDRLRTGIFYSTRLGVQWDWHTDSTAHYIHAQYLNFWIPLIKPDRRKSGLCIVGFDSLASHDRELASHFTGRGSARVVIRDGKTVFHDNDQRTFFEIPDPDVMDKLAVAPDLGAGDALIMRNDVFHRTQDGDTERLAISFRVISSKTVLTRQALMDMGAAKFNNMARMRPTFARRFAAFQIAQRDELTCNEYDAIYDELEAREKAMCRELDVAFLNNNQFEDLVYDLAMEYAKRPREAS